VGVEVGQEAPDFELSQGWNKVKLSDFRGKENVVLVFYPFTFTGVCQGELCALRDDPASFESANAQVIAISCDSPHSQARWAEDHGFGFPVLGDFWPHGAVARAYGVFNEGLGCADRATFVIDKAGNVVATFASPDLLTPRGRADYEAALAKLP
jgi:peroxiredoxin